MTLLLIYTLIVYLLFLERPIPNENVSILYSSPISSFDFIFFSLSHCFKPTPPALPTVDLMTNDYGNEKSLCMVNPLFRQVFNVVYLLMMFACCRYDLSQLRQSSCFFWSNRTLWRFYHQRFQLPWRGVIRIGGCFLHRQVSKLTENYPSKTWLEFRRCSALWIHYDVINVSLKAAIKESQVASFI